MKLSQSSLALLEDTLKKAIGKYTCGCEQTIVTDIHLQPNQNSGELSIFDDEDEELANTSIEEWMTYEGDDFYENVERILSSLLCNMKNEGKFDKLTILKPFSFVLVDDDRETIAELLLMDDDTLLVNEELANTSIEEWMTYEGDDFYENVERILSSLLCNMKNEGKFDKLTILKPFSFVLVDDDRETIAELLLMDDDTLLVNEELLKGLDEELDSFLKELLEK